VAVLSSVIGEGSGVQDFVRNAAVGLLTLATSDASLGDATDVSIDDAADSSADGASHASIDGSTDAARDSSIDGSTDAAVDAGPEASDSAPYGAPEVYWLELRARRGVCVFVEWFDMGSADGAYGE
jgi:hypothetical protein